MTLPHVPAAWDSVSQIPEALAVTLGSPDAWDAVAPVPEGPEIQTAGGLVAFLQNYAASGLVAREIFDGRRDRMSSPLRRGGFLN